MSVVLVLEGVLTTETGTPISQGELLFRSLVEHGRLVISTEMEYDSAVRYLRQRGLTKYAAIMDSSKALTGVPLVDRHLEIERVQGQIDLVIEADPAAAARHMGLGLTVMLFGHPVYARPEFRPDWEGKIKPWTQLVDEMERRRDHLSDPRLLQDAVLTDWE